MHLRIISSKGPFLYFTLSNLWYVISQLSQSRPRHRCFLSFFEYFFEIYIDRTSFCIQLSFQKEPVLTCYKMNLSSFRYGSKNPATVFRCANVYYLYDLHGNRDIKIPSISQQIIFRPLSTFFFLESESMPSVRSDGCHLQNLRSCK